MANSKRKPTKIRPKLVWAGDGWLTTVIKMNGTKADRTIDFIHKSGQRFTLELNPLKKTSHYIGVNLSWEQTRNGKL